MAEFVQLTVKVDKTQLEALQGAVKQLNGQTVKIGVDTGAIDAVQRKLEKTIDTVRSDGTETHIRQINTALGETIRITEDLGKKGTKVTQTRTSDFKEVDRVQREVNRSLMEMEAQERKLAASMPKTPMQQRIDDMLGIGRETKSAAESAKFFEKQMAQEAGKFHETSKAAKDTATATKQYSEATKEASGLTKILCDTLGNIAVKIVAWQVINTTVATVIRSFKEAVQTMREVDQELTNIAKVSNLSAQEIKRIGDGAYDAASRYGVSAKEYLSAVYTFQKAGMGESSEQMAELATKTMLVGDTTADVASKFIIATNAAWGYNGAMDKLSIAVDQADYINNNYATTLDKIADSLPIVASTAANMNMTYEETIALLGTINSKTQETGRKTATAVRSFLIAISGQVGEFVDDVGETYEVTTENIEALTDALAKYGNAAVKQAAATGEIINPMEALNSLAQAYKDNLLTDTELQEILIKVAGKMRYNSLVTIVKDLASETSTYRDMLGNLGNAAGTAETEVSKMLESWNAKTQILKNTWTQFLTNFINSDVFKAGIDALTAAVKILDTGFGRLVITVTLLNTAFTMLSRTGVGMFLKDLIMLKTGMTTVVQSELAMTIATEGLAGALKKLVVSNPLTWLIAGAAAAYAYVKAIDAIYNAHKRHAEQLDEIKSKYDSTYGPGSEFAELKSRIDNLTDAEKERLAVLELEEQNLRKQLEHATKIALADWRSVNTYAPDASPGFFGTTDNSGLNGKGGLTGDTVREVNAELRGLNREMAGGTITAEEYKAKLQEMAGALKENAEFLRQAKDLGIELTPVEEQLIAIYDTLIRILAGLVGDSDRNGVSGLNVKLKSQKEIYDEIAPKAKAYTDALNEMATAGGMTDETMKALIAAAPELEKELRLTEKGWVANKDAIEEHLNALKADYQMAYDNAASAASVLLSAEDAKAAGFKATTGTIYEQIRALATLYGLKVTEARENVFAKYGNDQIGRAIAKDDPEVKKWSSLYYAASSAANELKAPDQNLTNINAILAGIRGRGTGGTTGGSTKTTEKAEDKVEEVKELTAEQRIANRISLRKSELSMMEKAGYSEADQIVKMREIQDLIHDRAEAIRATAEYQEAARIAAEDETQLTEEQVKLLQEVVDLGGEWNDYQSKIEKSIENTVKVTKDALKSAIDASKQSALDLVAAEKEAAVGPLQAQLDALKAEKDTIEDAREEEEKLLAVEKARVALANAQRERTVRIYNSATGRWENVADQNAINSAKEELKSAKDALSDYYRNRSITALEKNIETIQGDYDTLSNAISDFATAINDGTRNFTEAMSVLLEAASGTGLTGVAGKAATAFTTAGKDTILAQMIANGQAWGKADAEGKKVYEKLNEDLGYSQGWTKVNGAWYDQQGNRLYDSGGILRGLGGIKATRDDEMILPPSMTRSMLTAERNGSFDALLNHLGIVTAAAQGYAGYHGGIVAGGVGSQHNGDVYSINGVSIGEAQARGMTVYDLAQWARNLSLHNA